jgi:hypothetical protein
MEKKALKKVVAVGALIERGVKKCCGKLFAIASKSWHFVAEPILKYS